MSEPNVSLSPELPPPTPGKERRAWIRFSLRRPTYCHAVAAQSSDRWWLARVHDISVNGVGLSCDQQPPPGTVLAIMLEGVERLLLARVAHLTPQAEDNWKLGCEFVSPLTDQELHAIL